MKRLLAVLLLVPATACVSQGDFDEHLEEYQVLQQSYDTLLTQLTDWSMGMYDWASTTGRVICDVARTNGPLTQYPQRVQDYCGAGDPPGSPPMPPSWGE